MTGKVRINEVYDKLLHMNCRYFIIYGGRRSSKSWSTSQLIVRQALEFRPRRVCVLRKFATSIRNSVWERVKGAITEQIPLRMCEINKSERRITLPGESEILFVGADDVEKLKSIEDVGTYWLEEATEFTEHDFDVIDAGMSSACVPAPQIYLTFNPVPQIAGYQHWLQERFLGVEHELGVPRVDGNTCVLRTWYKDNHMCPQETIDLLEGYKETNPALYKMWALGEFSLLEGSILRDWDVVPSVPAHAQFAGYAIDFGYAHDPAAVVAVWRHRRELWVEQRVYATGLTNPDLSAAMESVGIDRYADIVADCAEPKSIEELRRLGWQVTPAQKIGKTFKRSAALYMQGLTVHVLEDSPDFQRECATWSWRQDKEGHVLPLVADGNDHCIDALIYRVYRPGGSIEGVDMVRSEAPPVRTTIVSDKVPVLC